MDATRPAPRLDAITDPVEVKRILTTLLCHDADGLPKVEGAGEVFEHDGLAVQRMHNGLLIEEGCYAGAWMTEIIRSLRGHHEPQEEVVFDAMIRSLAADSPAAPRMIEFGSFWSFYSLWFGLDLPGARILAIEPDPNNLEVGRRNVALNGQTDRIEFLHGAVGDRPGELLEFTDESDGEITTVRQYDLESLLAHAEWDRVDLVLADVQGAETILLERARGDLAAGRVRFLLVSTHHHSISGDPLTHQNALALLTELGAHVIAEHSVSESFSGDGLIAVSFDPRDSDLTVPISYARARDTIFGELEWDLNHANYLVAQESTELGRIQGSRTWRWTAPLRSVYSGARRVVRRTTGAVRR